MALEMCQSVKYLLLKDLSLVLSTLIKAEYSSHD